jgi:hypothetical protein
MLSRILVLIITFSLTFPAHLFAQDTEEEPQFTQLQEGESAPFAGTLFNPTATAQLIAEREFRLTDCDLRVNYEINLLTARHELEYNLLQVRYRSLILEKWSASIPIAIITGFSPVAFLRVLLLQLLSSLQRERLIRGHSEEKRLG